MLIKPDDQEVVNILEALGLAHFRYWEITPMENPLSQGRARTSHLKKMIFPTMKKEVTLPLVSDRSIFHTWVYCFGPVTGCQLWLGLRLGKGSAENPVRGEKSAAAWMIQPSWPYGIRSIRCGKKIPCRVYGTCGRITMQTPMVLQQGHAICSGELYVFGITTFGMLVNPGKDGAPDRETSCDNSSRTAHCVVSSIRFAKS